MKSREWGTPGDTQYEKAVTVLLEKMRLPRGKNGSQARAGARIE